MSFSFGYELILKCYEQSAENSLWQMWLTIYPNMTEENFISFAEYKDMAVKNAKQKEPQTDEQMLAMAKMLNAAFGGEVIEI